MLKPSAHDLQLIGFYLGKVLLGLGVLQLVPLLVALALSEWNSATAFAIGAALAIGLWSLSELFLATTRPLSWAHAMVIVALSWLVGAILVSVPMLLSGRFTDPLHACSKPCRG